MKRYLPTILLVACLAIAAPTSFAAPAGAELRCTVRDEETGETVATFSVPAPAFQSSSRSYVFTGADLRNFIGDTSRPATDKTLRGAIKPYIDHLGSTQNVWRKSNRGFSCRPSMRCGARRFPSRGCCLPG